MSVPFPVRTTVAPPVTKATVTVLTTRPDTTRPDSNVPVNQPVDDTVGGGKGGGHGRRNPCPAAHFHFRPDASPSPQRQGPRGMGGSSSQAHRRESQLAFSEAGFCCIGREPPGSSLVWFSVDVHHAGGAADRMHLDAALSVTFGLLGAVLLVLGAWAKASRRNRSFRRDGGSPEYAIPGITLDQNVLQSA